jgi:hypothetical protein
MASTFRRAALWLAALSVLALAVELAVERHWTRPSQLIAWGALALAAVSIGLVRWRPSPGSLRAARLLAAAVVLSALVGIWQHVESNYEAGPLDAEYGEGWDNLSETTRWWLAVSKTVGPSPLLAPGALAQAGVLVLLAAQLPSSRGDRTGWDLERRAAAGRAERGP